MSISHIVKLFALVAAISSLFAADNWAAHPAQVISLDGGGWFLATDLGNVGQEQQWWLKPQPESKPTNIPRTMQSVFPGYYGAVWYWRDIDVPNNPHKDGRYLLRFWDVDYYADVWVNGTKVGSHEGLQCPFELDVTDAIKVGSGNRLAVRVVYPGGAPVDGFTFAQTAHSWSDSVASGGILDSVELIVAPLVRIENLYVFPDPKTGKIAIEANLRNAGKSAVNGGLELAVSAATGSGTLDTVHVEKSLPPGDTLVKAELAVENPRLWDINDPFLYRVTARVAADDSPSFDESATRCGFKDFRFKDGYFRLNGRRIFLRSAHTATSGPAGGTVPYSPEILRRELVACKAMGFNMVRYLARAPQRVQLELADEIGLMIYQECSASWLFADSPKMGERFDRQLAGMIRRDRNHPCIAIWGMLNETGDGPIFRHAVNAIGQLRTLDKTRPVILASGRFDALPSFLNGLEVWKSGQGDLPNVVYNPKPYGIWCIPLWPSHSVALNPGTNGEYSVVRWTAPADGEYAVSARFRGTACFATTDVYVLRRGKPVFEGFINLHGHGDSCDFSETVKLAAGETIDFIVGWGGSYGYGGWVGNSSVDNTQLSAVIKSSGGATFDLAADFSKSANPNGAWSYGTLAPAKAPDATSFAAYAKCETVNRPCPGDISNPGSNEWETMVGDMHMYPRVPHRDLELERLRTTSAFDGHLFLAEYGVGSGVHFPRMLRHYEAMGEESCRGAQDIQNMLAAFTADWTKWKLGDEFGSPEDFFDKCIAKMGNLRKTGINAIRANPRIVGYSVTGLHDPFSWGEGVLTNFREHKPGTFDAMTDSFAPLRWCLFAEPVSVYRGQKVKLEAVLANEDVLKPGKYPARLQVLGPTDQKVWEREVTVTIPAKVGQTEAPFAIPVFSEEILIDGPSGKYRLTARLLKGGAASGENVEFYVTDPHDMPAVQSEVVLWGEDKELANWFAVHGIKTRPFVSGAPSAREVILVSALPGGAGDAKAWHELAERIVRGSTVVFLSLDVFARDGNPLGWLPIANKGVMGSVTEYTFPNVYNPDEWAKKHPIFDGLPTGLMDWTFYRELIPDYRFAGQDTPEEAVAGSFRTSFGYSSALMLSVYKFGSGRFILNSLRVRQSLGQDPTAEHLLRNMLNFAGKDSAKPLADLPAGFEENLKAIGY